ncbi:MAG: T9SS type A sorting domain-containing protein [Candidatus Eisenbacteria bacterium]|uniref:T9SS type A sorting domain-containing protein n=1 Tax=Eiseniibacteriota bacterium TaxID=2212470 RepID=A0A538SKX5_UNCEI|nr:MAG: T9SS type A sorting domain-containing protein [Candidatus Eisenbacteria bacterium]
MPIRSGRSTTASWPRTTSRRTAHVPEPAEGARLELDQSAPNPLRDGATITFRLPAAGRATIDLYDLAGRFIGTVFDGERPAGTNSVWLDGARLGPGAYFYRLSTNGRRLEKKMVLSR